MDVFNHGLWSFVAFHKRSTLDKVAAVAFGTLPDLVVFMPAVVYLFLNRIAFDPQLYNEKASWVFQYAYNAYNYTHSLVIFAVIFLLVYAIRRKMYLPMLAWGLHILMDIPTHPDFYQTPFLFPISDYRFPWGISWGQPVFFAVNYGVLALSFILIYVYRKKKTNTVIASEAKQSD